MLYFRQKKDLTVRGVLAVRGLLGGLSCPGSVKSMVLRGVFGPNWWSPPLERKRMLSPPPSPGKIPDYAPAHRDPKVKFYENFANYFSKNIAKKQVENSQLKIHLFSAHCKIPVLHVNCTILNHNFILTVVFLFQSFMGRTVSHPEIKIRIILK